jgi:hypothetical protein
LALPAGISISGCVRNPAANFCNGQGFGLKTTDVAYVVLQPQITGISMAYGQTMQVQAPTAYTCKNDATSVGSNQYHYATTNNQLADISPTGQLCAGTWNRNTGGGIADYTYCYFPNPAPSTGGLPYSVAYITATADSITSNPVAVYIHAPVTAINLVATSLSSASSSGLPQVSSQQCFSQNQQAQLNEEACYAVTDSNGVTHQYELCAPSSVTSNFACTGGAQPSPNIIASGNFSGTTVGGGGSVTGALYLSGGTITGTAGQTCNVSNFNNGASGASATLQLTGSNAVAAGTALIMVSGGSGATAPPTQATLSNGSATCSGTIQLSQIVGLRGQYCYLTNFNNGSSGATATVTLTGTNTIAGGSPLAITDGGMGATSAPTQALLTSGTAHCAGQAALSSVALTPVPSCSSAIGTLSFQVGDSAIATINPTTNVITAQQPGTTAVTATIAQSSSAAGYFSTCPPASIKVSLANGADKGVVAQGVTQNLTTTVLDTQGNPINGLNLEYESTNPIDISVTGSGTISTLFPGVASVYAVCEPGTCNPSPINEIGLNGTGLSLASNPVDITVPGTASDFVWFAAPGQSQYFGSIELLTGNPGATSRLPYVPNSMVMDQGGNNLYFGSNRELMVYSTSSNLPTRQDPSVPGVVLAVSPNNSQVLINDQIRGLFYLYNTSSGTSSSFGGMGVAASWTPDSQTLYIVDSAAANSLPQNIAAGTTTHSNKLYVHNANTGWTTYDLTATGGSSSLAITNPSVGAYLAGAQTVAHTWCPAGTVGNNASIQFYPQGDSLSVGTDVLGATLDGRHLIGTALNGSSITLDDIGLNISATPLCPVVTTGTPPNQVQTMSPLSTNPSINGTVNLGAVTNATAINQVVVGTAPTTASVTTATPIAFITYTTPSTATTSAKLPYYLPQASGVGPVGYVTLAGSSSSTPPTAPLAGTFSPDNSVFLVSTAGDNKIHFISIPTSASTTSPPTDTQQYSPNLPACTPVSAGGVDAGCLYPTAPGTSTFVPTTVITIKPRKVT